MMIAAGIDCHPNVSLESDPVHILYGGLRMFASCSYAFTGGARQPLSQSSRVTALLYQTPQDKAP